MGLFAGCNSFLGHSDTPLQKEPNKAWLFLFLTLTRASRGGRGCSAGFLGTHGLPALPPATLGGAAFRAAGWVAHAHRPHFLALHCQEFGGKNYEASMSHVDKFVKELLSSDAMKEYNRARVYLDENYKSQEHFTALGSFYFLHESLKNIYQFDFKAKKYKKVTGKEIYSDTLESTPMLEKEKFPQDYFPECKWSRKGFIRTRWCVADCAFDLVNIHLFHDASNLVAWETSPSVYSGIRRKALGYVLDRISDQRFEKASYFVFGDFNFRLDSKSVVETLCTKATMQTVRAADTNEVVKLIFRESDNDRKVTLQLEKKLFDYVNQEVFRDNNGTALLEFDKELSVFKDRLCELDISFPPSYPYSEDSSQGKQYMNTRCPAWCDRVLMSPSAKELILRGALSEQTLMSEANVSRESGNRTSVCGAGGSAARVLTAAPTASESEEKVVTYDHIGPSVCMGDHKPVFLAFRIAPGAGKPHARVHKCCVVQ
nr:inositol polyphosphate-5-phosphatase A isoform X1 [Camelus dromedarius]